MSLPYEHQGADGDGNSAVGTESWEERARLPKSDKVKARKARRARLRRREKIQRVADAAAEQWLRLSATPTAPRPPQPEGRLLRPLPRPRDVGSSRKVGAEQSGLPFPRREVSFKAGPFRSALRLLVWIRGGFLFARGVVWDKLQRHDTQETRARRLRETFENMGTTFIKIGQQLSMRLDLFPPAYIRELEKLMDDVPAFPSDEAILAIERSTGKPLEHNFSAFDPEPIGKASVACVYQAVLKSGERVAVKVRRPGVGPRLAADLRALGWLLTIAEQIFFTPGFFDNFTFELKNMLMEELDFVREARFAELYRRRARKTRQMRFVSVPRVFFRLSNEEVMVAEFVTGIWLKDILQALETKDREVLAKLEEMKFDRVILARRIQLIARFNNFENIFFHADLHSANILIQPRNKVVLIDFGSCGSFNTRQLNSWRRWFDAQSIDDVGGMVQAALGIMEPLPPIDRDRFGEELELKFWSELYAIKSKHAQWSERIVSRLWYSFLELSQKFQIPMRLNTLRMIRASMLTDTIAIRLDHHQDAYREFRYYEKGAGRRAKKRVTKRLHRLAAPRSFIGIEHGIESALKLVYQVERTVDSLASIRIGDIITKIDYFLMLLFRHFVWIGGTFVVFLLYGFFRKRLPDEQPATFIKVSLEVLGNPWAWIIALFPNPLVLYRLSFRLKERKPWNQS
jgi:ubiquinone biosynthesis protein